MNSSCLEVGFIAIKESNSMELSRLFCFAELRIFLLLFVVQSALLSVQVFALDIQEPAYCDPAAFDEKEFTLGTFEELEEIGLVRPHAFHLGKVTLVGVGVGNSKAQALVELAQSHTSVPFSLKDQSKADLKVKKYCTWYLNHPKKPLDSLRENAAKTFNQKDINRSPVLLNEADATAEFMSVLEGTFDQGPVSFLSCASEQHYIAMGCNEMMHRGPTAFGMLLAFSGCSPAHSLEIVDQAWGLNGVRRKVRLAVIRKAYELGEAHQGSRKRLADLFR